jgi:septum formation protein
MLAQIGYKPDLIVPPELDETPLKGELPKDLALRLAKAKAEKVHEKYPNDFILAADTVCAVGRLILPKAETEEDVSFCLHKISGRRQIIYTGVCGIFKEKIIIKLGKTLIKFKTFTPYEIENFIADPEQWQGKAGGYTMMGKAASLVTLVRGDQESNVIGLPLFHTKNIISTLYHDRTKS